MPEGPEVAIMVDGLNYLLKGKYITRIQINSKSRYFKRHPDGFNDVLEHLPLKVIEIESKGKFIYYRLESSTIPRTQYYILQSLGLSGGWYHTPQKNSGMCISYAAYVSDGDTNTRELWYDDKRRFGTLLFTADKSVLLSKLADIGPDMLTGIRPDPAASTILAEAVAVTSGASASVDFNNIESVVPYIRDRIKRRKNTNVTVVLMDQGILSGVGNYIKCEALYMARINPMTNVNELSDRQLLGLCISLRQVIKASYKSGGMGKKYSDVSGETIVDVSGNYPYETAIYNNKVCPCGHPIKHEETPDGRNTYWCPAEQTN